MPQSSTVVITLTPQQIARADAAAHIKRARAIAENYKPRNNFIGDDITAQENHLIGDRAELACCSFLGEHRVTWHDGTGPDWRGLPDITAGPIKIDTKARRKNWYDLICPHELIKPDRAYVAIGAELHPDYHLIGWSWGHELMAAELAELQPGRPARIIRQGDPRLKDCADLLPLCFPEDSGELAKLVAGRRLRRFGWRG